MKTRIDLPTVLPPADHSPIGYALPARVSCPGRTMNVQEAEEFARNLEAAIERARELDAAAGPVAEEEHDPNCPCLA